MDRDELGASTVAGWLSPKEAEEAMARVMRTLGFRGARATRASRDGGIDVIAEDGIAQVKMHMKATSRPDIQTFVGAAEDHREKERLFFAAYGYTSGAQDYADRHGVALFQFDPDLRVTPINQHAQALVDRLESSQTTQKPMVTAPAAPDPIWIRVVAGVLFVVSFLMATLGLLGTVMAAVSNDEGTSQALAVNVVVCVVAAIGARFFYPFMMARGGTSE